MKLQTYLDEIPDFRRAEGKRYPLTPLLMMITMGIMSGWYGYREIATFLASNQEELETITQVKWKKMPSHVTVRTILQNVDSEALMLAFNHWCQANKLVKEGDYLAIDGKCLGSTVTEANTADQSYIQMVSAFTQTRKQVVGVKTYASHKQGEGQAVRDLLVSLDLEGVMVSLDALHCQKKR